MCTIKNAWQTVSGTALLQNGVAEIPVVLQDFSDEEIDIAGYLEEAGVKASFVDLGTRGAGARLQAGSGACGILCKQQKKRNELHRRVGALMARAIRQMPYAQALKPTLEIWISACNKLPPPLIGGCMSDLQTFVGTWINSANPSQLQNNYETQAALALRFIETGDYSRYPFDLRLSWLAEQAYEESRINQATIQPYVESAIGYALFQYGAPLVGKVLGETIAAAVAAITRRYPQLAPRLYPAARVTLPAVKSPGVSTPTSGQPYVKPSLNGPFDYIPGKIDYSGLRFGSGDLAYGPSAGGRLRDFANSTNVKTLQDLFVYERHGNLGWNMFSKQEMERVLAEGFNIRFDLTSMRNIQGVLAGTAYPNATTTFELRYLQANWARFSGNVKFYTTRVVAGKTVMVEVNPPWIK